MRYAPSTWWIAMIPYAGAHVADVGCGHGASTVVMARAFPQSHFTGFDYHPASIDRARTGQRKPASMSVGKELLEHPEHVPSAI